MKMIETVLSYLQTDMFIYALVVGILISLCSALLGVTLVLKRFSFIGDGLSHVAFGAAAVAAVVGLTNEMYIVLPVTVICAVLLLKTGQNSKIKGDASVAMISVGAIAVGYLLMSLSNRPNKYGDVCSSLFGSASLIMLTKEKVWICVVLSLVVLVVFTLFYNKIFCVTFDETFSKATGGKTQLYNMIIAVIIAVIIVLAMNLVGSLLISALVIFPALSAMRMYKSFKSVTICSAIISVICSTIGIFISVIASTPVGATIVIVDILAFGICYLISFCLRKGK